MSILESELFEGSWNITWFLTLNSTLCFDWIWIPEDRGEEGKAKAALSRINKIPLIKSGHSRFACCFPTLVCILGTCVLCYLWIPSNKTQWPISLRWLIWLLPFLLYIQRQYLASIFCDIGQAGCLIFSKKKELIVLFISPHSHSQTRSNWCT